MDHFVQLLERIRIHSASKGSEVSFKYRPYIKLLAPKAQPISKWACFPLSHGVCSNS